MHRQKKLRTSKNFYLPLLNEAHSCAINFRDLAIERGRQSTRSSPEVCLQKASRNLTRISRHFLETRGSPGKPGRLKDRERHGTGDKDEKCCKWNTNFYSEVSTGKTGLPFQKFHFFRKFSSGMNRKVVFHLHPNRNFRIFLVNGKRPPTQPGPPNLFLPITKRAQNKRIGVRSFRANHKLMRESLKAAKCEIQKPSTCRATLFRCKFSSMFPVFHLA